MGIPCDGKMFMTVKPFETYQECDRRTDEQNVIAHTTRDCEKKCKYYCNYTNHLRTTVQRV